MHYVQYKGVIIAGRVNMGAFEDDPTVTDIDRIYMERAQATSTVPLIFLNPNALDRDYYISHQKTINPSDLDVVRGMMDSQIAGISSRYPEEAIRYFAETSMDGRHFSLQQSVPSRPGEPDSEPFRFAFINLEGNNRQAGDFERALFASSPQAEYYWSGFWGGHEGDHAGFEHLASGNTFNFEDPGKNEVLAVNAELSADRNGLDWLRSEGQDDIAQAVIDFRALNAFADRGHSATAILADEPGTEATVQHVRASTEFQGALMQVVGQDLGLAFFDVISLQRQHPGAFHSHLERLIDEGAFDQVSDNPHVREYIVAYSGAYQRQIADRTPDPEAHIDLRTDRSVIDSLSIRIGNGVVPTGNTSDPGKEPPANETAPPVATTDRPMTPLPSTGPRP